MKPDAYLYLYPDDYKVFEFEGVKTDRFIRVRAYGPRYKGDFQGVMIDDWANNQCPSWCTTNTSVFCEYLPEQLFNNVKSGDRICLDVNDVMVEFEIIKK